MVTLLTSELASKSCNYISFLSSTSKYGNDSGKYTDGVYPLSLRDGYHFPLLMVINNVFHRGIPVFPAGTDLFASALRTTCWDAPLPPVSWASLTRSTPRPKACPQHLPMQIYLFFFFFGYGFPPPTLTPVKLIFLLSEMPQKVNQCTGVHGSGA